MKSLLKPIQKFRSVEKQSGSQQAPEQIIVTDWKKLGEQLKPTKGPLASQSRYKNKLKVLGNFEH